ncbi:Golgi apparatus membrane protein tvp38 [Madurella mycetomatis]|uniref:Golgi apparatus membrane protein TVP38 n=1 Tax=Madurella mycetomatis TaxID=100816 RepID=A0A175VSE6_9PEZI|nr:Golgi apparatus membrane protein tvp38 [Madurella mycetomatis]
MSSPPLEAVGFRPPSPPSPSGGAEQQQQQPGRTSFSSIISTSDHDHDYEHRPWATRPTPSSARRLSARRLSSARSAYSTRSAAHSEGPTSLSGKLASAFVTATNYSLRLYLNLSPVQRGLLVLASTAVLAVAILFLVYSHRIFTALAPVAAGWRATPGGWVLLWLVTAVTAFPPLMGYSTCVTVAGFVYGFPVGWPIAASATVAGSAAAFVASRGWLRGYVHGLAGKDRRFVALGQVLRRDGIGVLAMIRLCPLPYSLSNGFLATVGSIRVGGFAVATALSTPKLLVHVFIGSRLALLAESGDKMSAGARAINYVSMFLFGLLGFGVGLFIYRRTMARAAELAREAELEAGDALLDADGVEEGVVGVGNGYDDDGPLVHPDELDAAAIMDDDDISLWETEGGDGYTDGWDDGPRITGAGKNGVAANGKNSVANGSMNGVNK